MPERSALNNYNQNISLNVGGTKKAVGMSEPTTAASPVKASVGGLDNPDVKPWEHEP